MIKDKQKKTSKMIKTTLVTSTKWPHKIKWEPQ